MWIAVWVQGVGPRALVAGTVEYVPARVESNFQTVAYFIIDKPIHPRTHLLSDEGTTWCRDTPEAVKALQSSLALL